MNTIRPILQISVKHSYYKDGLLSNFRLIPSPSTAAAMKKVGLHAKMGKSNLTIAGDDNSIEGLATHTISFLNFYLVVNDPQFFTITDLPDFSPLSEVLNFNTKEGDTNEPRLLHQAEFASKADLIERDTKQNSEKQAVDLVQIFIDHLPDLKTSDIVNFEIRFNRRKVYWQYLLLNYKENQKYNLVGEGNKTEFTPGIITKLPDGSSALEITSKETLELQETYDFYFKLEAPGSPNRSLRLPQPNAIQLEHNEEGAFVAKAFVYL